MLLRPHSHLSPVPRMALLRYSSTTTAVFIVFFLTQTNGFLALKVGKTSTKVLTHKMEETEHRYGLRTAHTCLTLLLKPHVSFRVIMWLKRALVRALDEMYYVGALPFSWEFLSYPIRQEII